MSPEAVETDLLAAIAADPDAIEPRLIYADWLLARNDPRGELIVVQAKLRTQPDDARLRSREKELTDALTKEALESVPGKPLSPDIIENWHRGFIHSLKLSIRTIHELRTARRVLLERPEFAQVRELDIDSKFARTLRFIRGTHLPKTVRCLKFGSVQSHLDEETLVAIARELPNLVDLHLRCRDVPKLGALTKLKLRTFALHVLALVEEDVARIREAPWPIETFVLRMNMTVAEAARDAFATLWDGSVLGSVKHLELDGVAPIMDVIESLAASKRIATIETFTADFNRMPYGAQERAERHRDALKHVVFKPLIGNGDYSDAESCNALGGFLNYRLQRPAEALPFYEQALRIKPEHVLARHNFGIALRKVGRFDESLAAFDTLISASRSPTASMFNGRHYTLCELGRREEARADLERAIKIDPNYADAWNNLGCELQNIGDPGAVAAFRRCVALDANHNYARRNEADLLLELGLAGEALPIYLELIAAKPGVASHRVMLAYAQLETGDLAGARANLDARIADLTSEFPIRLHVLRAVVALQQNDVAAANADLDIAARMADCPAWYAMTLFIRSWSDRALWTRVVPSTAITSKEIADAVTSFGRTERPAGSVEQHEASVDDQMDCSELAIGAALLARDRALAVRRARALGTYYVEQGPRFQRKWWQTLGTAIVITNRSLDEPARALLDLAIRRARGRGPIADLVDFQ